MRVFFWRSGHVFRHQGYDGGGGTYVDGKGHILRDWSSRDGGGQGDKGDLSGNGFNVVGKVGGEALTRQAGESVMEGLMEEKVWNSFCGEQDIRTALL